MKHSKILITMAFTSLVAIAAFTFSTYQKTDEAIIAHSNFLENFEPNSKLTLDYRINNETTIMQVNEQLDNQGSIQLEKISLANDFNNYEVSYELRNEVNGQEKFQFQISENKIKSQLKGLPLKSSVLVTLDKKIIEQKIPADWSGAISFNHFLNEKNKEEKRLCFIISHRKISTLCHVIPALQEKIS